MLERFHVPLSGLIVAAGLTGMNVPEQSHVQAALSSTEPLTAVQPDAARAVSTTISEYYPILQKEKHIAAFSFQTPKDNTIHVINAGTIPVNNLALQKTFSFFETLSTFSARQGAFGFTTPVDARPDVEKYTSYIFITNSGIARPTWQPQPAHGLTNKIFKRDTHLTHISLDVPSGNDKASYPTTSAYANNSIDTEICQNVITTDSQNPQEKIDFQEYICASLGHVSAFRQLNKPYSAYYASVYNQGFVLPTGTILPFLIVNSQQYDQIPKGNPIFGK